MIKTIQTRGFNKVRPGMKVLVDLSITPKEMATIQYRKLYEQTMIRRAERQENHKRNYLQELKEIIKNAI